jgi:hypothetical protein
MSDRYTWRDYPTRSEGDEGVPIVTAEVVDNETDLVVATGQGPDKQTARKLADQDARSRGISAPA